MTVLIRSLFAFLVVAAVAIAGFVLSDTQRLDNSVLDASLPSGTAPPTTVAPVAATTSTVPATTTTTTTTAPPEEPATDPDTPVDLADIPQSGTGAFLPARATTGTTVGAGNIIEFSVAVEQGSGIDADELAAMVDEVLGDPRSWIAEGDVGFRRIETGGLFTLVVATADTVDQLCVPLQTNGFFSCGRNGWVALNLNRWLTATDSWTADLTEYRTYLINHEVGHYLARPHVSCPGSGQLAPVMMQQTKGTGECQPNGWPYP